MLFNLQIIPIHLLALFIFSLIWWSNVSSSSRCDPKCFWVDICWTVELLNRRDEWYIVYLPWKNYLLSVFWWVWIEGHFPLAGPTILQTLSRSLFSFLEVFIGSLTDENIEVSSAKSVTLGSRLSDKLLIYI